MRDDSAEIRQRLTDQLEDLLGAYCPGHVVRAGVAYPEPSSERDLGSWVVHLAGSKRGTWYRSSQGIGGDPINLLAYIITGDHKRYGEAFREAKCFLGIEDGEIAKPDPEVARLREQQRLERERQDADRGRKRRAWAWNLWKSGQPIAGTPAEAYLISRGLAVGTDWPVSLRYHPAVLNDADRLSRVMPCLIAYRSNADRSFGGLWRIFIKPDGSGKADCEPNKVGLARAKGSCVRLGPVAEHISVAEGLESSLAVREMIEGRTPVWATLNRIGLQDLHIPPGIKRIDVYPDGDKDKYDGKFRLLPSPGLECAKGLQARGAELGVEVIIQPSAPGKDPLNILEDVKKAEQGRYVA